MNTELEKRLMQALEHVCREIGEISTLLRHTGHAEYAKQLDKLTEFCQSEVRHVRAHG